MAAPNVIRPANLDPFFLNLDTLYQRGYLMGESTYEKWAQTVISTSKKTVHGWLDKLPKLREWIGPRDVQNLVAQEYDLTNKTFELTFAVSRDNIDDDQYNLYGPAAEMLGIQAKQWPDDQMTPVVEAGASTTTFDGANFFSASHPIDTANPVSLQSNLFTTGSGDARPLTAANLAYVRAKMRQFKGRDGKPFGINPNLVMVPPALEQTALQIANAEFIVAAFGANAATGSQTNVLKGTFDVVVNPKLTSDTAWYAMDARWPIKAFIWQQRMAPEFAYFVKPTDISVFDTDSYKFGVRARGVGGYGLWFMAAQADV